MTQTVFQNARFCEDNLGYMIKYCREIETPDFEDLRSFFVSFYVIEQPQMYHNLVRLFRLIFGPANFENQNLFLFKAYKMPLVYAPGLLPEIFASYPLIDKSEAYGFPPLSEDHSQKFELQQWKDTRYGKLNFTSVELRAVKTAVWYFKNEADEVTRRSMFQQHKFDRGLRILLQKLKEPNPVVDLSVMFNPAAFFGRLRFEYLSDQFRNPSEIVFLLTLEKTEIAVENLIIINADVDDEGKFFVAKGSKNLRQMWIKVCEFQPEMVKVGLYRRGSNIGAFWVVVKEELPANSVFLLTAFTTPLK
jgi:hypothetical protein